jgi:hypothetical protein
MEIFAAYDWKPFLSCSSYSFVSSTKLKAAFEKYFHCRPLENPYQQLQPAVELST